MVKGQEMDFRIEYLEDVLDKVVEDIDSGRTGTVDWDIQVVIAGALLEIARRLGPGAEALGLKKARQELADLEVLMNKKADRGG